MSPTPDPAEISAPKDPAAYREPRLLGVQFWAWMAFGLACALAGAAIAFALPRLLVARPPAPPPAQAPAAVAPTAAAPDRPAALAEPSAPAGSGAGDIDRLNARVAALESQEASTSHAAAAALAAAALVEATQRSGPFVEALAGLRAAAPGAPELAGLARLAEVGAPSRAALAASFPDYAARAASAARAPGEDARLRDRLVYAISKVVTVRRVGDVAGSGADARLARAELMVADGDLDRALDELDGLPAPAREALAPWRARAERRAEIDRQAAALRARALRDLVQPPGWSA